MKYDTPKSDNLSIKNMIETIQADCLLVAKDKGNYEKITDIK
tara:strand:+ start:789 stop:914 length:126 start_codon:yes stop_codon:yes gene_type:complete